MIRVKEYYVQIEIIDYFNHRQQIKALKPKNVVLFGDMCEITFDNKESFYLFLRYAAQTNGESGEWRKHFPE